MVRGGGKGAEQVRVRGGGKGGEQVEVRELNR